MVLYLNEPTSSTINFSCKPNLGDALQAPIISNQWYHVLLQRDRFEYKLFVNGVLVQSGNKSTEPENLRRTLFFGGDPVGTDFSKFNGKLDDIAIYNRALTQQEITALYNSCTPPIVAITPKSTTNIKENESVILAATQGNGYSYEWYKDGIAIPNAIDSNFTATTPGKYTVKISTSQSCDSTSAAVTVKRVYNLPTYLPTNGLVGWWPFNGNANDESGNANHGTVSGATLTSDRNENSNKSFSFNRVTNNEINVSNSSSLNNLSNITISLWVKLASYNKPNEGGYNHFINKSDQNNHHHFVFANNSNQLYFYYGGGINGFTTNHLPPLNQWSNLTVTYNYDGTLNSYCKFYINGSIVDSMKTNQLLNMTSHDIRIGSFGQADFNRVDGKLDDIAIYNRALTQQEIRVNGQNSA
jgi:Concanavalin A-like lectin/glucanases superfamily